MPTSKFDNLVPLDGNLPTRLCSRVGRLRKVAAQVRSRCGTEAWVDKWRDEICFGYDRDGDTAIAFSWPIFKHYGRSSPCHFELTDGADISVDDICYAIQIGRVSPALKNRWMQSIKQSGENDRKERLARTTHESIRHGSRDVRREMQRSAMGKHWRGSAVVNGFKE